MLVKIRQSIGLERRLRNRPIDNGLRRISLSEGRLTHAADSRSNRAVAVASAAQHRRSAKRHLLLSVDRRSARFAIERTGIESFTARRTRRYHRCIVRIPGRFSGAVRKIFSTAQASLSSGAGRGSAAGAGYSDRIAPRRLKRLSASLAVGPRRLNRGRATRTGVKLACYTRTIYQRLTAPFAIVQAFRKIDVAFFAVHKQRFGIGG